MSDSTQRTTIRQLVISYIQQLCNNTKITDAKTANETFQNDLKCKRNPFKKRNTGNYIQPITLSDGKTVIWFDIQQWGNTKTKAILINMAKKLGVDPADYGIENNNATQTGSSTSSSDQNTTDQDSITQDDNEKKREALQVIYYGAPGTGKSWAINNLLEKEITYRTTFHPDTDYATFVGCYKPSMDNNNIIYCFTPQIFLIAYLRAWYEYYLWDEEQQKQSTQNNKEKDSGPENENKNKKKTHGAKSVYLIIEEINRGNCAQVFGDIFQLLDRNEDGYSSYPIIPDQDIVKFIKDSCSTNTKFFDRYKELIREITKKQDDEAREQTPDNKEFNGLFSETDQIKLAFPPNFHIWATMNTSDQSLYPMDSAFKRRWEWEYVKINTQHEDIKNMNLVVDIQIFSWPQVIERINEIIKNMLHSADKQIGEFFIKCREGQKNIDFRPFRDKVLFYLFNDVFKDNKKFGDEFFNDSTHYLYEDLQAMESDKQEETVSRWLKEQLNLSVKGSKTKQTQLQQSDNNSDSESEQKGSDINVETTES